jgi:pyridoxamine 5'-phosphate oxidase family protein
MSAFTDRELEYLTERRPERLGRLATVGKDGTPHVVPVGWRFNPDLDAIESGGSNLPRTKKFRDVRRSGLASIVIDDLQSVDPWRPRGIEIRGRAEAIEGDRPRIRVHPERIVSWGLESEGIGRRHSRTVVQGSSGP